MQVLLFTLLQGLLSTLVSLILGLILAWCLASTPYRLAVILRKLLALPFLAPSIVGILGYVTLFSQQGYLGGVLPLYGLGGVVMAHTFFYAPFAAVFLWQAWQAIPHEQLQVSLQLGLSPFFKFLYVEVPLIKPYLFTIFWLVFCMSLASFTTVLVLGGGPHSTTLPVALYQSLFHTLDFSRATLFAALQMGLCILAYSIMLLLPKAKPQPTSQQSSHSAVYPFSMVIALGLSAIFLAPLVLVFYEAWSFLPGILSDTNLASLQKSFLIALCVGPLATLIAFTGLVFSTKSCRFLTLLGSTFLIAPLSLLGFAAFWMQLHWSQIPDFLLIVLLNVFLTLPFALHFLKDPILQIKSTYTDLTAGLGMDRFHQARLVLFPLLRKPLGQSLGFCSALAAGDLTALLMFSDYETPGLSSLLYQQMGGYRGGEAMATALLLLALCWGIMSLFQLLLRAPVHART